MAVEDTGPGIPEAERQRVRQRFYRLPNSPGHGSGLGLAIVDEIAKLYGMLPAESGNTSEGRTAADNATVRTVFVVGPDKKIKLQLSYPMSTGRNFDEILRVIDSMQLTAKHKVATPVNWKTGDDVIILPSVSNEEAQQKYRGGWKSPKPYLRIVPQPK